MPVKLRLSRQGRKKAPFYHIVVADSRAPRDGKFIEKIGTYNPMTKPATIDIDRNAAYDWLVKGAQPTDTVRAILRFKGVYYKKHLMRGMKKGALTQEQVDTMWQQWIDAKESKITARIAQTKAETEAFRKAVSGSAKVVTPVSDAETQLAAQAFRETEPEATENTEVVEAVAEVTEASAPEVVAEAETVVEAVTEEAPASEAPVEEAPAEEGDKEA
jgi:small subunit ribosomal protein S16